MTNILEVKNLTMHYETLDGDVDAVKNISFNVKAGESFGIVGESGCGKTSVAMSLLQLQAENGRISNGSILFDGIELVGMSENDLRKVRWDGISIVFQGAMNADSRSYERAQSRKYKITKHIKNKRIIFNGWFRCIRS